MSETIIYSKPSCPSCVQAKKILDDRKIPYRSVELGTEIQPQELFDLFESKGLPQPRTAPQIFLDGKYIGGYDQLVAYIEDTGYTGTGHTL